MLKAMLHATYNTKLSSKRIGILLWNNNRSQILSIQALIQYSNNKLHLIFTIIYYVNIIFNQRLRRRLS